VLMVMESLSVTVVTGVYVHESYIHTHRNERNVIIAGSYN